MRQIFALLFSALLLFLSSCQQAAPSKKPEESLGRFIEAISSLELKKAEALSSPETLKNYIEPIRASLRMESWTEAEAKKALGFRVDSLRCQENQGQMRCTVCCTADGAEAQFLLIEENGYWLVHVETALDLSNF